MPRWAPIRWETSPNLAADSVKTTSTSSHTSPIATTIAAHRAGSSTRRSRSGIGVSLPWVSTQTEGVQDPGQLQRPR